MSTAFRVWCPERNEDEGDGRVVVASDEEEAAEEWARRDDHYSAEYSIVAQRITPLVVVLRPDGQRTRWRVRGESAPRYYAVSVPVPEDEDEDEDA